MKFQSILKLNLITLTLVSAAVPAIIHDKINEAIDTGVQKLSELLPQSRILGGDQVVEDKGPFVKYPFMVSLQKDSIHRCGGTLLTEKVILTAAHCSDNADGWFARVNVNDLQVKDKEGGPQTKKVSKVIRHPNYDPKKETNDLAVWVVSEDGFTIFGKQLPYSIKLASRSDENFGIGVITLGWGVTSLSNKQNQIGSQNLNSLKITLIEPNRCRQLLKFMKSRDFNSTTTLCAGNLEGGKDTCQGDSGGPLFVSTKSSEGDNKPTYILFGLTSYGIGCGREDVPGAYTRISNYLEFITKSITDESSPNNNNSNKSGKLEIIKNQGSKFIKQLAGIDKLEAIQKQGKGLDPVAELFGANPISSKFQADINGDKGNQVDVAISEVDFPDVKSTFQPRYF